MSGERMKVNDIFERLCRSLASNNQVQQTSNEFYELSSNLERVNFAANLLEKHDIRVTFVENKKNALLSTKCREDGNKAYTEKKDDHLAWILYNKCIAYAPLDSETLALAFANRSALLLRKKLYKECLADIDRAFAHNYPKRLHDKLEERRSKARQQLNTQEEISYYTLLPPIAHRSKTISCASNAVEIKENDELGRHVVARTDIAIGTVLAIEQPYACTLLKECAYTHCHNCLEVSYNMIQCKQCTYTMFCSEKCQKNAWKRYHKYECPILSTLYNLELTKFHFLALRIAILARNDYPRIETMKARNKVYKSGAYEEVHFLQANTHKRTSADLFPRSVTASIVFSLLKAQTQFVDDLKNAEKDVDIFSELLLRHMQTGPTNFHSISECCENESGDYDNVETGAGTYSFLSLLNHSCNPNVIRTNHGTDIVLRALRPIEKGEQLLDNYGYHYAVHKRAERQRQLKRQYFFDCQCEACLCSWPMFERLPNRCDEFDTAPVVDELDNLVRGDMEAVQRVLTMANINAHALDEIRPCRDLSTLQETIKRCYALLGNKWARL